MRPPRESDGRLHDRWNADGIVLPPQFTTGLEGALLLRLTFDPSSARGWSSRRTPDRPTIKQQEDGQWMRCKL